VRTSYAAALLGLCFCLSAPAATAAIIFRVGDTVYVDGKQYSWEEWKRLRDSSALEAQPAGANAHPAAPALRAASCITSGSYDQFPGEAERFQCSGGLGAMTREEMLRSGWKIDFVEKIPADRLYKYKLVISR
jgi:hypothetical protein